MLSNVAGIDVPELVGSWPVFDSKAMDHLDPMSTEKIDEFVIADWMYEAVAEHVVSPEHENNAKEDERDIIKIKTPDSTIIPCSRCQLLEPTSPSEIYNICISFFNASNWYELVADSNVRTPKSCFVRIPPNAIPEKDYKCMDELEDAIKSVGEGKVFARMDHASPKRNVPCTSAIEVLQNLSSTERTAAEMRKVELPRTIMLREYVDNMSHHIEIRCFVHGGIARACNLDMYIPEQPDDNQLTDKTYTHDVKAWKSILSSTLAILRESLRCFLGDVVAATEYRDFVADVALHRSDFECLLQYYRERSFTTDTAEGLKKSIEVDNAVNKKDMMKSLREKLWLIEINTPVYMLATAGHFCLDNKAHQEILLGPLSPLLSYPCMLASVAGSQELLELFC